MSVTTFANGIPVLSIPVSIGSTPATFASLPWNGINKPYEWTCTLAVTAQLQSGVNTRQKFTYNGQDINVGQWIGNLGSGLAWQIISITSKTTTTVTCIIQDTFRYNTYRDPTKTGNGKPPTGAYVVFELAANGTPMVDPSPTGIGTNFLSTLITRFAYVNQEQFDFPLSQPGNTVVSFKAGDILAIDEPTQTYVEADASHVTTTVGQVTAVDDTGTIFTVNPIGKVIDNFNFLPGQVGQFLYTDTSNPGQLTITPGGAQIYLQVRNYTASVTTSATFGSPSTVVTTPGNTLQINGVLTTISGTGTLTDVINAINATSLMSGVTASILGTYFISIVAVDARAIGFEDISGTTTIDVGLTSTENGVKGAVIVVTSSVGGVSSITAGSGISVNASTGAVTITNSLTPAPGFTSAYGYVFTQVSPLTTWTIVHNANTLNVATQIFDNPTTTGNNVLPDEITVLDVNTVQVSFGAAQAGKALLTVFK